MPRITPVHWKVLERVFIKAGFCCARQEGSHRSYVKPGIIRNNLKTAAVSRDQYFHLLEGS